MMNLSGTVLGYDPGGDNKHGIALFTYEDGLLKSTTIETLKNANEVIDAASEVNDLIGVGIDTLTCWSTGTSGWRPADRWLKQRYGLIANSIVASNSLYGAMGINGMSVLIALRMAKPDLAVTETHPKVLWNALSGEKYDSATNHNDMDQFLSKALSTEIKTKNDHEWDAVVSAYAVLQGINGEWSTDLHHLPCAENERLVKPCGETHYWWPN